MNVKIKWSNFILGIEVVFLMTTGEKLYIYLKKGGSKK